MNAKKPFRLIGAIFLACVVIICLLWLAFLLWSEKKIKDNPMVEVAMIYQPAPTPGSDLDAIEADAEIKIPNSAREIHAGITGFREINTWVRFDLPAEDLVGFLQNTQCDTALIPADPADHSRSEMEPDWWQPGEADKLEECTGGHAYLRQSVLVDHTSKDILIIYVFSSVAGWETPTPTLITPVPASRTNTIVPPVTLKPTYTASPTVSPSNTLTPTKTLSIIETPTPPGMALLTQVSQIHHSPDGAWLWGVENFSYQEEGKELQYSKTVFVSKDGKAVWTVWPKTKDIGNVTAGQASYTPIFWLPSEPYVYLAGYLCCRDGPYDYTGWNLARLDLRTGAFSIQVSGWSQHSFAFSKEGKYLLDTHYKSPYLRFIRLSDWKYTDIPIDPKFVINEIAVFSPDQNKAAVQACEEFTDGSGDCYQYNLLLVDIKQGSYRILISHMPDAMGFQLEDFLNNQYYFTYSWITDSEIVITAQKFYKDARQFIFDLTTNQMREVK